MSKRESNDPESPGYCLPEDSQLLLKQLRDHLDFLSRLAQPRTSDEEKGWAPEVRMGELAACLALLAGQAERVLEELSRTSRLEAAMDTPEPGVEADLARQATDEANERFAFGVTVDQIDALDRLIQTISAHGDVMAAGHIAELAGQTLPWLGQLVYDDAQAVRDILNRIEAQRLGQTARPRPRVREAQAVYRAGFARPAADSPPRPVSPPPAYPPLH